MFDRSLKYEPIRHIVIKNPHNRGINYGRLRATNLFIEDPYPNLIRLQTLYQTWYRKCLTILKERNTLKTCKEYELLEFIRYEIVFPNSYFYENRIEAMRNLYFKLKVEVYLLRYGKSEKE